MRISDTRVPATLVFCYLSALAIGCGDSVKESRTDAATDSARDTALLVPDTAVDVVKPTPSPDSAGDAVAPDLSPEVPVDGASPDWLLDANRVDSPQSDAAQVDGTQTKEVGGDTRGDSAVPTTRATVTFHFKNTGTSTLYVHQACTIPIKVTSLTDGTTYGNGYACACDCASPTCNGNLACGACAPPSGVPIEVGSAHDIYWAAELTTSQTKTGTYGSFQCLVRSPIPTGPYKVEISVYTDDTNATNETNSRKVEKTFTLGTADATVEIPVQ